MSSPDQSPEEMAESSMKHAGGLGEVIPEPLMPVWTRIELIQSFRQAHGDEYINVLEILTAIVLLGGYVWWLYLFFIAGG
jgi:hypothetical protein